MFWIYLVLEIVMIFWFGFVIAHFCFLWFLHRLTVTPPILLVILGAVTAACTMLFSTDCIQGTLSEPLVSACLVWFPVP